jgi:hypothetical protein
MTWVVLTLVALAGWVAWAKIIRRRRSLGVVKAISNLLATQAMLFSHEVGTPAHGRAADRFSTGYVFGFAVSMLVASGKRELSSLPPLINSIFEQLFGQEAGQRVLEHDRAMKARDPEAARGAAAGRQDAIRYLKSGGQRDVTGWLQHVRADLFADAAPASA